MNKKSTVKNGLFNHLSVKDKALVGMATVGLVADVAAGAVVTKKLVDTYRAQESIREQASITAEQQELIQQLRVIATKMDLSAEEIEQMCNDYDIPLAVFIERLPAKKAAELTK